MQRRSRAFAEDSFDSDALAILHEISGGRLRDIDRIATDSLKRAARRKLRKVDRKLIESVIDIDDTE